MAIKFFLYKMWDKHLMAVKFSLSKTWAEHLVAVEFSYNTSVHACLGQTHCEAACRFNAVPLSPSMPTTISILNIAYPCSNLPPQVPGLH